MELLLKSTPNTYETGDLVVAMPDGHGWGNAELDTNKFTITTGVTLTESEENLLLLTNDEFKNVSAISQIPAFRHSMFKFKNMNNVGRRKYYYENEVVKK